MYLCFRHLMHILFIAKAACDYWKHMESIFHFIHKKRQLVYVSLGISKKRTETMTLNMETTAKVEIRD